MVHPVIIAIAGTLASGKDSAARFLKKKGFCHFSLSDEIREIIRERGQEPARELMHDVAIEVRSRFGDSYLVERILEKIKKLDCRNIVVTSIHRPEEAAALKKRGARLWFVDAPFEVRFERARSRGRIGDGVTFEAFKAQEERELASEDPGGQQIGRVLDLADERIDNGGTEEDLYRKIDEFLERE
ncbi:MAG: hypothetical protein A2847_02885 [Candidatus Sungbacteria bacterium RIFCSPHIGHO2_01_FULL_50_25]|uniref:Dephospho-CoA kinase n=1 Tax=Candidatus Sungbacteria bacterium RIFCSPHIGHO2_01_FULL_50_25 TaxID=1802265 RepID=A0A1G2KD05_9BACT|nr:MAG: hypothetical protein A2847_02885 [Candidatus Sungbacteria bacterium RIFCSPHIGHO2_01_FULL_50_25]